MSESVKLTDSELAEIKMLQEKFQDKVFQLGQLYLQKMQVESQIKQVTDTESKLREDWQNLSKMQDEFVDKVLQKYGEGQLDLKGGLFLPDKKQPVAP